MKSCCRTALHLQAQARVRAVAGQRLHSPRLRRRVLQPGWRARPLARHKSCTHYSVQRTAYSGGPHLSACAAPGTNGRAQLTSARCPCGRFRDRESSRKSLESSPVPSPIVPVYVLASRDISPLETKTKTQSQLLHTTPHSLSLLIYPPSPCMS